MLKFCCGLFEQAISLTRQAGFHVVPTKSQQFGIGFRLMFLAADESDFGKLLGLTGVRLVLQSETYIKHCPFCGVNLASHYEKTFEEMPHVMVDAA